MCGRARLSSDVSEIKLVFSIPPERPSPNFAASWNVAPTDSLPVVHFDARVAERSLDTMRWGLVPYWAKDIKVGFANINARAEGIDTRPAFREAFQRRRCLVPLDSFYEWKKLGNQRQPYAVALADRRLMAQLGSMVISREDIEALAAAVRRLERPGFAGRVAGLAGKPAGFVARVLPGPAARVVARAAERALEKALDVALFSLRDGRFAGGRVAHSALASASGAVGGGFGLAALAIELPVSTTIMLRAIAAIARQEGEDLGDPRTGLACLEVFALGGPAVAADADADVAEGGYFAVRALLARGLAEAAEIVVDRGAARGSAIAIRFLAPVVARFGAVVSEKLAVQAVAVVGALGGAAINLAFIEHFQDLARGHFTVRRLERIYGAEAVRGEYDRLKAAMPVAA